MAHTGVTILIFWFLNAIECGEASSKFRAAVSSSWYCHRLLPAVITSAVTPCTYPCLLLSPYEHPRIVVYPEPDGTPCRITTTIDHHIKVGKCRGSVCRMNAPHATLKRKKRFLCLYSLVKLIIAKKKLRELKEVIQKLEQQVASRSSGPTNSLGGGGTGAFGISNGGAAAGGGSNIGIPVTGVSGSSTGRNPFRENSGVIGGSDFRELLNSRSGVIMETGGSTAGNGRSPTGTSPGMSDIVIGNSGSGRMSGSEASLSHPGTYDFGSTGMNGRVGGNAGLGRVDNSFFSGGSTRTGVSNAGIGFRGSGIGGTSSGSVGFDFPSANAVGTATREGSASDTGGSGISVNGASSTNSHSINNNSGLAGGSNGGSLPAINMNGGGMSGTGSTSTNREFPTRLGGNIGEPELNGPNGANLAGSNLVDSVANIAAAGTSAVSTISTSSALVSHNPRSGSRNSDDSFSRP